MHSKTKITSARSEVIRKKGNRFIIYTLGGRSRVNAMLYRNSLAISLAKCAPTRGGASPKKIPTSVKLRESQAIGPRKFLPAHGVR